MSNAFFYEHHHRALRVNRGCSISFHAHLHREIEFFLLLEGSQQMFIDGQTRLMQPGEAALILPNRVHSYSAPAESVYLIGILDMSAAGEYASLMLSGNCTNPFLAPENVHPDIFHCAEALADAADDLPPALARAYTAVILGRLSEALALSPAPAPAGQNTTRNLLTYISEHISEPLSLELLSKKLFINKYSISRIFSEQIGCSLHTYVNALRVELAQNLLRDSTLTTSELIFRCGFESERTFYRIFREYTGMTSRQYRQQVLNQENH